MNELQTIADGRLLIKPSSMEPLRLAWSFEPSPKSIVENLIALDGKNPCDLFPTLQVTKGLRNKQENFVKQLSELVFSGKEELDESV